MVAVVPDGAGGARVRDLGQQGRPAGPEHAVADLAAYVRERADDSGPPVGVAQRSPRSSGPNQEATLRWLWPSTAEIYPALLRAGLRVERCHDLELTEALLLGYAGRWGEPRGLPAAWARLTGTPVPPDPPARAPTPPGDAQGTLFEAPLATAGSIDALVQVYADQRARIDATEHPGRFRLLVAAESASALVAAEMGHVGLPWRADVHDQLLTELLGHPSPTGGPPRHLAGLARRIAEAFGVERLHPDSPAEVLRAFTRAGISLPSTRAWVLRGVDHPAVPLLLQYKELYRIWTAHGWAWRNQWVHNGRFRAEYVPGGVVSGRWATRGGGALQIPKVVRRAVVADPGWVLVAADAGQLEPRVLAAVSGDGRLAAAAAEGDLYAALATEAFGGDRSRAKVALLGAMYGQTGGAAVPALAALRKVYPTAWAYVEQAARTGEAGGLVRSWLGRTCPPPSVTWSDPAPLGSAERGLAEAGLPERPEPVAYDGDGPRAGAAARARGRFTRNFVIQGTAAEWANALLATLRPALWPLGAELVFFQHDEVLVHCRAERAEAVVAAVQAAGDQARRLLFADTSVRFPLDTSVVECYADAD